MRGEQPQRLAARPMLEALEPRVLLDGASPDQALQLFSVSPARHAPRRAVLSNPQACGARILHTAGALAFDGYGYGRPPNSYSSCGEEPPRTSLPNSRNPRRPR